MYGVWAAMKRRCLNSNVVEFKNYGGRGISVCTSWRDSFGRFLADMGERPPKGTLERIDNDGNYEPGNCRWATRKEQGRNTRTVRMVTLGDAQMSLPQACEITGLPTGTVHARIRKGWPEHLWLKPKGFAR